MTKPYSAHFFGKLFNRMAEDLHLAGMSQRTHAGYLRAVRRLADYCKTPPAKISEDQLRRYFLHLKNERKFAYGSRMPSVADALRQHAPAYLRKFGEAVPVGHRKVIGSIIRCRSGALGGVAYRCDDCGRGHWYGRSCGNRHCPGCGADKTTAWLAKQTKRLMPVHHFLVTVTAPDRIGLVLRAHQRAGYGALLDAGATSIRDVAAATKSLRGCQLGFFGVLHTWGRDPMVYHPHVHVVVPGGGVKLDEHGNAVAWQSTPENFLFHHETLVRVEFRNAYLDSG